MLQVTSRRKRWRSHTSKSFQTRAAEECRSRSGWYNVAHSVVACDGTNAPQLLIVGAWTRGIVSGS